MAESSDDPKRAAHPAVVDSSPGDPEGFAPRRTPKPAANPPVSEFGPSKLRKRGAGGKLSRSETVTVRLDPKLRYLAELAARKQRRTLSSYIEWAIEENLKAAHLDDGGQFSKCIANESAELWDVDEPDRFVKLAIRYPEMLTHDEQVLWKLIRENGFLWKGHYEKQTKKWTWKLHQDNFIFERLREHWGAFRSAAYGSDFKVTLPTWAKKDPDEGIPF